MVQNNITKYPIGEQGDLFNMDFPISQSLLQTTPQLSTGYHEAECDSIEIQRDKKRDKNKHFLKSVSKVPPRNTSTNFIIAKCLTRNIF